MLIEHGYHVGDCRDLLKQLPNESIQCVVTSPPYWGLRDYGVDGQIGLEESITKYIETLVIVFSEVRRVLRSDGTLWLNMGDAWNSGTSSDRKPTKHAIKHGYWSNPNLKKRVHAKELKTKDLIGMPWMLAFALRAEGWYLRSEIIWHKPTAMPEPVKDRPTRAHEQLFLMSKCRQYYYDADAIKEDSVSTHGSGNGFKRPQQINRDGRGNDKHWEPTEQRNKRSVWTIATEPSAEKHFATFPTKLVTPCILAGTKTGDTVLDPFGGSGTVGRVAEDLGRKWILFDLNPEYAKIAKRKTAQMGLLHP